VAQSIVSRYSSQGIRRSDLIVAAKRVRDLSCTIQCIGFSGFRRTDDRNAILRRLRGDRTSEGRKLAIYIFVCVN
jgi:hypothetical protein